MRRLVFPAVAAIGLVMVGPSSAFADDPNPTVSVKATAGKSVCKVTDQRLDELSGLVATKTGFVAINDGTPSEERKKIFFLDTKCKVVDEQSYSGNGPRDPEDMILSADGKTLWIADIGDNDYDKSTSRPNLTLWTMPVDGSKKPTVHRVSFADGDHHDAEALLLTGDNIPLIITKEIGKPAGIYQPSAALKTNNETGVPLKKVGELTVNATETAGNPYARIGNKTIDGGAIAPGGAKVALRTYTDALEWDVTGGDVLTALLKGKPRTTGLPNETLGEAITYSADGSLFYTTSDMSGDHDNPNSILKYTPATTVTAVKKASSGSGGGSGNAWYADLTLDQITYAVGAVGLLGLILVGAGVIGITRHRKRVGSSAAWAGDDVAEPGDPETELIGVGGAPQRPVYGGGARSGAAPAAPGVYGGAGAPGGNAQRSGPVYGAGGGGGAPQYARPPQGGQPRGPQQPGPGGQPPRGPQQPGGQPPRGPQQQPGGRSGPVYGGGGGGGGGQQYAQPPRGPQGQRPQRPAGPQGQGGGGPAQGQRPPQGQGQRPAQGPRSPGAYGPPGNGQGRPPQRGGDGYADRNYRPEERFDNPGYRR
ncbi:hypothetical protein [Actinoplanes sp. NPDC026619]|uniref:hypothetical protein n=1 Tax=Actinoplanes sp. NPDC026619 TaxID=3155798 RepID=UPI0033EDAF8B